MPVIKRLPRYYRYLGEMENEGVVKVSSSELARMMGTTASQVRQDFNCFGGFGQQGIGYNVKLLREELGKLIFSREPIPTILIGAGNLGHAMANFLKKDAQGFELLAAFEDNSSAEEFRELLSQGPITVEMEDYGGFEKVGPLGTTLTRNDTQITTEPGDVILYQGNQITIYYGTNSWSFTRLARIDDPTDLRAKLGEGAVQVTFSLA